MTVIRARKRAVDMAPVSIARARRQAALAWIVFLACCGLLLGIALAGIPDVSGYTWQLPRGFPTPAVPADNPMSDAKVALGQRLFFERRLSPGATESCATCHDPARSFTDGRTVSVGATGQPLAHSAMALVNVAWNISFGWTQPTARTLEDQMRQPLLNQHPVELGLAGREEVVCAELAADPHYMRGFAEAFPGDDHPVTFDHLIKAIASFERTLVSGGSAFDHYVFGGEHTALSASAKRGMALFFSPRVGCAGCHSGFNFAGPWREAQAPAKSAAGDPLQSNRESSKKGETGRPGFARNGTSGQPMRVPTLRNIALTSPYMHDGRFATLEAVVGHYSAIGARTQAGHPPVDPRLPRVGLSQPEQSDLIAFLTSLTDNTFVRRFALAGTTSPRS
jgi:cytochrome c peroxidase